MIKRIIAGLVAGAAIFTAGYSAGHHSANHSCTFDGGGVISDGSAARVTTGQVFMCQDGTLVKING